MHQATLILILLLNCLLGTSVEGAVKYNENDVFVQYVTVNIEDINVGDFVYSYDTITGTTELKEVTDVFVRESDHINYLTIVDENGNVQVLETTDGHPFWVVTDEPDLERAAREVVDENSVILYHENIAPGLNGFWVEAKDLREGDVFVGANGELSVLVSAERVVFPENVKVYNFTVEGNHNYFVIAATDEFGQTCILVHNAGGIYVFDDLKNPGKKYVGQSEDIAKRLAQHQAAGRLSNVKNATTKEMQGATKLASEIAEHKLIQKITKGVPAKKSSLVSNKCDPIGPKRAHFLKGGT